MTIRELINKGLLEDPEAVEVSPTRIVEHEEFMCSGDSHYQERAIERLIAAGVGFCTTANNAWDVFRRYVKIVCPQCGTEMAPRLGTGSCDMASQSYECQECKMTAHITIRSDQGISFYPSEKGD